MALSKWPQQQQDTEHKLQPTKSETLTNETMKSEESDSNSSEDNDYTDGKDNEDGTEGRKMDTVELKISKLFWHELF